jgi:2-keto-4-pentenoate hydratase
VFLVPTSGKKAERRQHEVQAHVGARYHRAGNGANVLGDPRTALTWIVDELSALGIALQAGCFVTTGTCMVPLDVEPGDDVSAKFGVRGSISLRCVA